MMQVFSLKSKLRRNRFFLLFLLSLWTTVLHGLVVVDFPKQHPLFNFYEETILTDSQIKRTFQIKPDYYLLKVIHSIQYSPIKEVIFNGKVIPSSEVRRKSSTESNYFHVYSDQIQENNLLEINFIPGAPKEVKIRLRNYQHSLINNIVTFHKSTLTHMLNFSAFRSLFAFLLIYLLFCSILFLAGETSGKIGVYIILVLNLILSITAANNLLPFIPQMVFVSADYFWFWYVLAVCFTVPLYLARIIYRKKVFGLTQAKVLVLTFMTLITPVFLLHTIYTHPGLYPVEAFDESAHTYTEIPLVQKALLDGHILKMNFFNNFGTPLLGDPVTNPFALHALTYLFLKPNIAMICNKILLSILTFLLLFLFYRRRSLSFYSSILTAFLTFTVPSFFWFFQHHPHQGVLFYFSAILLVMELAQTKNKIVYYILLHFGFIVLFLSSGIMGTFLGVPFLLVFSLIITKLNIKQLVKLFLLPLGSGLILTHPQLLYFLKIAPLTARSTFSFEIVNPYSFIDLLRGFTFLTETITCYHTDYSINYSLVVLVFVILGLVTSRAVKNNLNILLSVILGLLPFLFVIVMLRYRTLQSSLPLMKSIDITRILWFSSIFLMIPLGLFFDRLTQRKLSLTFTKYLIVLLTPLLFLAAFGVKFEKRYTDIFIYVLSPIVILLAYYKLVKSKRDDKLAFNWLGISIFALLFLVRFDVYYDSITWSSVSEDMMSYSPVEFVEHMEQYSRLSSCQMPIYNEAGYSSPDQKIAKYNILGSAGRSIILHGGFRSFLEKNDLISFGWLKLLYYFKINTPDQLARFGIRYFVTQSKDSPEAENLGWKKVFSVKDLVLFENPLKPSPFYYMTGNQMNFIRDYKFSYDRIEIDLPPIKRNDFEVTATFIGWPGWKAEVDGKPVGILSKENQFITVNCTNGGKLVLSFAPYSNLYIITSLISSIVFMLTCCFLVKYRNRISNATKQQKAKKFWAREKT